MEQADIIKVMNDAMGTVLTVCAPILIIGMVVGIIISIFQATTQINEQSLAYVPKIIAIFLCIMVMGGFIITTLTEFTTRIFGYINTMLR